MLTLVMSVLIWSIKAVRFPAGGASSGDMVMVDMVRWSGVGYVREW